MYGLNRQELQAIRTIGITHPAIEQITLFGSRALGNYKPGSDIDLALHGNLPLPEVWRIAGQLNDEAPTLLNFDVISLDNITNNNLKKHIADFGVPLYRRV